MDEEIPPHLPEYSPPSSHASPPPHTPAQRKREAWLGAITILILNLIAWVAFGISKHDFIDALGAVVVMQFIYAPILAISFALMKKPLALASSVIVACVIIAIPFIFSFFVLAMCAMKGGNWH